MNFDFVFYRKLLLRRLPVMALFVILCSGLGLVAALRLPDSWETSARLLVEAPQIPDSMVASTVQTEATEQLQIIEQKLLTRANLIDIAYKFEVFEDLGEMEPDRIVKAMKEATTVFRSTSTGRRRDEATLMSIFFEARTAQIAADVVNEYVTLVLQENAAFRMSRAENTLQFFEQEVERLGDDLDSKSVQIAQFKSENADALPEEQLFRLERQSRLQERKARLEREIQAEKRKREDLVRSFDLTGRIDDEQPARQTIEQRQLDEARLALDEARAIYSDTHPRIRQLAARVSRLEKTVAAQVTAPAPEDGAEAQQDDLPTGPDSLLLRGMLQEIDNGIRLMEDEIAATDAELVTLEDAITRSSANGITLDGMTRDYEVLQARYDAAVHNLNEARMSERVETAAQGQRISVVENASVPQVPSGPDRTKIALLGGIAGIGLAGGYFMLLELLNRTVRRPAELTAQFDIVPIATIPYMESRRQRFFRRAGLIGATLAVLIAVPAALWYVDTYYLPLDLLVERGLEKLGLG